MSITTLTVLARWWRQTYTSQPNNKTAIKTSSEVQEYIKKQKSPQKEIVQKLRDTILETLPNIKEELKMGVPWYEGKFYVVALKDHVNLGFSVQGLSDSEKQIFEGKGSMMRHLKFRSLKDLGNSEVEKLLRLVAEKNTCY